VNDCTAAPTIETKDTDMALPDQLLGGLTGVGGCGNQTGGAGGGLRGLLSNFEKAGLGHLVQSRIRNGPNLAVSRHQLQTVFGEDQVQTMSC